MTRSTKRQDTKARRDEGKCKLKKSFEMDEEGEEMLGDGSKPDEHLRSDERMRLGEARHREEEKELGDETRRFKARNEMVRDSSKEEQKTSDARCKEAGLGEVTCREEKEAVGGKTGRFQARKR